MITYDLMHAVRVDSTYNSDCIPICTSKRENINLLFLFVLTALGNHIGSYYYLKSVE